MAQNVNFLQNNSWLGEEMLIKRSNGKRNRKGEDVLEDLGDIDFLCRTKSEVRVQELFPAAARCDIDSISTIPAGWDLYIEVTSMSGKLALFNEPSKVAKKLAFYETIFDCNGDKGFSNQLPVGVQINKVEKVVFFVYNGADFVDLKNNFKSENFQAVVVHLPMKFCLSWRIDVELKATEKKIQDMKREKEEELKATEKKIQDMKREKEEARQALQEQEDALEEARQALQEQEDALEEARQEIINLRNRLSLSEIPNEIQ
jgi:Skp family chaperone for outer membrane proteins